MLKKSSLHLFSPPSFRSLFRLSFLLCFLTSFSFSSVHAQCETISGGTVTFINGDTEATTVFDGVADELSFASSIDADAAGHSFTYVVTDGMGKILGIPPGNMVDFDPAGEGLCKVYGLSYTGNLLIAADDMLFEVDDLSDACYELSSNNLKVKRVNPQATDSQFFVSSNTDGTIGVYSILMNGAVLQDEFDVPTAMDADGIFYDEANDVLYQLNRTLNVINAYSNVSTNPTLIATSSSEFTNGREIAVTGNKLVVADDVDGANRLVVYDISPTMITFDKAYDVDINLWGIHANGNQLIAIVDNSSDVATFDNFFNQPAGSLSASRTVTIENMVRTHGLTYDAADDNLYLTDVGSGMDPADGALVRIKNWAGASADGMVSSDEQIRVFGAASLLGNPVDIALDKTNNMVYVAERANGGGRVLGFKNPVLSGGIAPSYKRLFPGASAIHLPGLEVPLDVCDFVDGGMVSLLDGNTEATTIAGDGTPDILFFNSTVDPALSGYSFTYVVTDANGIVLGVPPANSNDFEGAGPGACNVYGLSYTGNLSVMAGDDLLGGQDLSDDCYNLSHNSIVVTRLDPEMTDAQFFVSSNTSSTIGVYNILSSGNITRDDIPSEAEDADGIYYDQANDVLYQLNRTDDVINAYSNVSTAPVLTATSSSDFTNGREIAVANGKLIVADDVDGANKLVVYDISPTSITLDKIYDVDINLWGIHINGNQLFAIVDNSSDVAIYDHFFNQPAGPLAASSIVTIENMVRTHGITYVASKDMMFLTDVGSGASAVDGAFLRVKQWNTVSADGMVSATEQIRVSGASSNLGNPVDIAYDNDNDRVYVTERANGGGRVMCFKNPVATGGIAPVYNNFFPGASGIHFPGEEVPVDLCSFVDGGTVALPDGNTQTTTIDDDIADVLFFTSSVDAAAAGHSFRYVITDDQGMILGIPPGDSNDFDPAGVGACNVYGLSYTGNLTIMAGDDLFSGDDLSDGCFDLSDNAITVTRIAPSPVEAQFFVSTNTAQRIGIFSVLESGDVLADEIQSFGMDADGIYYDQENDVIYQLNRTISTINAISNVSTEPVHTATSTSDFSNGREIAVAGNKLVVAQDGNEANGNTNRLIIYDITPTAITLDRIFDVDINLWGIHANGNQLFAVVDNSSDVAVFNNFFNLEAGMITPDQVVTVENLVRTHGITYVASKDMMFLTDVGEASKAGDGAIVRIKQWSNASADGTVSAAEQIRVSGGTSQLGNPVDIAYDDANDRVYVAERANGGGRVMCFRNPVATGGIAPMYNRFFAGASAIHFPGTEVPLDLCTFADAGSVTFTDGNTVTTTIDDGEADVLSFASTVSADAEANGYMFTYVITDADNNVLGVPPGNSQDFDPAGVGACNVYGLAYTGNQTVMSGMNIFEHDLSDACFNLSSNFLTVNRIAPEPVGAQLFISSNTRNQVGTYDIFESGTIVPGGFSIEDMDADGIYYDDVNDIIYQLNRTTNQIDVYHDATTSTPTFVVSSSSDFTNGREIAVSGSKLIVADDVDGANRFIIYNISVNSVTLDKIYDADINLWGIHADGDRLIAVSDNTGDIVIYDNFLSQPAGPISPSSTITIEDMVRTHGLTYDKADDMLILTDVGSGGDSNDGALVVVHDFAAVSADGMVSADEQVRVAGNGDFLGNPVDVALDKANNKIYVAERANGSGRLLGFDIPSMSGDITPFYNRLYPGASAVYIPEGPCDFLTGGDLTFDDGTTEKSTIEGDGMADVLSFVSDVDAAAGGYSQRFVITDSGGSILGIPMGNSQDFDEAGPGVCRIYNVSYTGTLLLEAGMDINSPISDACGVRSENFISVDRTSAFTGDVTNFRSADVTNTSILADVYPVPVKNELNLVIENTVEANSIINIYNVAGSLVLQQKVNLTQGKNRLTFNVSTLENGMYFIQIPGSDTVTKFVKAQK